MVAFILTWLTGQALAGERVSQVQVEMTDGTELYTKVFLPKGEGPWPTVFIRVPYAMGPVLDGRCKILNREGYACAWQTVRGRGQSEGSWLPFEHEPTDGRESLDWVIEQPWCDGNIALMGESYLGAVQWAVAENLPPEVKTFIPTVIGTDLYGAAYQDGLLRHEIVTAWMVLMPGRDFNIFSFGKPYREALDARPRIDMDVRGTGQQLDWFRGWVTADDPRAPYWQRDIVKRGERAPERVDVPVLMIGGWADAFLGPQIETWHRLATQSESTLVLGPWHHLGMVAADVKQHGVNDELGLNKNYQQWERVWDWLGHHLRGEPLETPKGAVLTYPVNGGGWTLHDAWPDAPADKVLHFARAAGAESCEGELEDSAGEGSVTWTYDPEDPTPSLGGAGLLAGVLPGWNGVPPGFIDQGKLCQQRDDLVGFRSAPLEAPLRVLGSLGATLSVSADVDDTSFNVRFLEERADGRRIMIRESITQLSRREGPGHADYEPGSMVTVELETWPVDYVFEAGSRVLVQVAGASFPKYEAHANFDGPWAYLTKTRPARQTLHLQGSTVHLPAVSVELGAAR